MAIDINENNAVEAAKAVRNGIGDRPNVSPGTVRRSLTVGKLIESLLKAQAEIRNPPKDSINPHFKSRYADLATVRDCVVPVLVKHGLSVVQLPCDLDGSPALTTVLVHQSGEYFETTIRLHPVKQDPQGVGSALTYARRYALQSLVCIAAEDDDDGNAASQPSGQRQQNPQAATSKLSPQSKQPPTTNSKSANPLPANGDELVTRLRSTDTKLVKEGRCEPEELLQYVWDRGAEKGFPQEMAGWKGEQIQFAANAASEFVKSHPARQAAG